MVELNASFHAMPSAHLCEKWVKETPDNFLFDVRYHRALSRHQAILARMAQKKALMRRKLPPELRDGEDDAAA